MAVRGAESEPILVDLTRVTLVQLSELPDSLFQRQLARVLHFDGTTTGRRWQKDSCPEADSDRS